MKTITAGFLDDTINGIKVNTSIPCNKANYLAKDSREVSYIVMHYTGNTKDNAINNAKYYRDEATGQASAHYFVDDSNIYQSVALHDRAYHCGTTGKYYHPVARNQNSIGIEQCCTAGNYTISTKTIYNATYLCAYLCDMIGITSDLVDTYVIRHYDVTHKICPKQFVEHEEEFEAFKKAVKLILDGEDTPVDINGGSTTNNSNSSSSSGITIINAPITVEVLLNDVPTTTLVKGSRGDKVVWLQRALNKIGNYNLEEDGSFGNLTLIAVKDFQKKQGLSVDGSVGKATKQQIINVLKMLKQQNESNTDKTKTNTVITDSEKYIWDFLYSKIGNTYGVAGIMGNLKAESELRSNNLQNTFEVKLGYTDDEYVKAIDSGKYTNFVYDKAGFGLAQWTYWSRKKGLLDLVNSKNVSIADLPTQLEYLMKELESNYSKLLLTLKTTKSVKVASDAVLTQFEQPNDQSVAVKNLRAKYGQSFYDKYAKSSKSNITDKAICKYAIYTNKYFIYKKAQAEYDLIKQLGYSAKLVKSGIIYRVQVGGEFTSLTSALKIKDDLVKAGHQVTVESI